MNFTIGGDFLGDTHCQIYAISDLLAADTTSGQPLALNPIVNDSLNSCGAPEISWTGGTGPFQARFSPQTLVPLSAGFNVTQNATLDISNIPNRQLTTYVLYDAGTTFDFDLSDSKSSVFLNQSFQVEYGGSTSCFLQNTNSTESVPTQNGHISLLGPIIGGIMVLLVFGCCGAIFRRRRTIIVKVRNY